jgi:hypothetical protein
MNEWKQISEIQVYENNFETISKNEQKTISKQTFQSKIKDDWETNYEDETYEF